MAAPAADLHPSRLALWFGWLCLVALFVWCWQVMNERTIWMFVQDAPKQAADIGGRMWPPRWSCLGELMVPLWDTLNMTTLGTLLGVILATVVLSEWVSAKVRSAII